MISTILCAIALLLFIGCTIVGGIYTATEAENEQNILKYAFYIQWTAYRCLCNEINLFGIVLVLIASTLLFLPCNLMMLSLKVIGISLQYGWKLFKRIFRKRK